MDPVTHAAVGYAIAGVPGAIAGVVADVPMAALIGWQVITGRASVSEAIANRWPKNPTNVERALLVVRRVTHGVPAGAVAFWFGPGVGAAYAAHLLLDLLTHCSWWPLGLGPCLRNERPLMLGWDERLGVWVCCVAIGIARRLWDV